MYSYRDSAASVLSQLGVKVGMPYICTCLAELEEQIESDSSAFALQAASSESNSCHGIALDTPLCSDSTKCNDGYHPLFARMMTVSARVWKSLERVEPCALQAFSHPTSLQNPVTSFINATDTKKDAAIF